MDSQIITGAVIATAATVIGTGVGAYLSRRTARKLAIEQQQKAAAAQLHDELVEIRLLAQLLQRHDAQLRERLQEAGERWHRARLRFLGRLGSDELTDRVAVITPVLMYGHAAEPEYVSDQGGGARKVSKDFDLVANVSYIIQRAFEDALASLEAFLSDENLPPRSFPTVAELHACIENDRDTAGTPFERIRQRLNAYEPLDEPHHKEMRP